MSNQPPQLFDRQLLRRRRERVQAQFAGVDFLFRRAAEDMLERIDIILRQFPLALDLGAGHGLLASELAARPNIEQVIAADHSAALLRGLAGSGVALLALDEEFLPFREASLDLITCMQALHFVNDLPGALIQIRRALKPDGLFMAALPGGRTLNELRTSFMLAEEELCGGVSPRVAPMADVRDYGGLLQRAGFALPVVDNDVVMVTYESPLKLMRELRLMGAGNVLCERLKKPVSRALLQRVVEIYAERFSEDGRILATFEIIHMSGWAPDPGQQQPLVPGSASTPLSQALSACALPDREPDKQEGEKE